MRSIQKQKQRKRQSILRPQKHMVIIVSIGKQVIGNESLSKCFHSLKLLHISNILDRNRMDVIVRFSPTLFLEGMLEFTGGIDCFLLKIPNSGPPVILRVFKIRFPFSPFIVIRPLKTFTTSTKGPVSALYSYIQYQ